MHFLSNDIMTLWHSLMTFLNVIKLENATLMCIIQCREKYNCKNKIQRWLKMIWRWPELIQSETDELELKTWNEPSLSPVPWFRKAFHSLSTTFNNNQFKSELKNKVVEILKKEDDYIRISDVCLMSAINILTN